MWMMQLLSSAASAAEHALCLEVAAEWVTLHLIHTPLRTMAVLHGCQQLVVVAAAFHPHLLVYLSEANGRPRVGFAPPSFRQRTDQRGDDEPLCQKLHLEGTLKKTDEQ